MADDLPTWGTVLPALRALPATCRRQVWKRASARTRPADIAWHIWMPVALESAMVALPRRGRPPKGTRPSIDQVRDVLPDGVFTTADIVRLSDLSRARVFDSLCQLHAIHHELAIVGGGGRGVMKHWAKTVWLESMHEQVESTTWSDEESA